MGVPCALRSSPRRQAHQTNPPGPSSGENQNFCLPCICASSAAVAHPVSQSTAVSLQAALHPAPVLCTFSPPLCSFSAPRALWWASCSVWWFFLHLFTHSSCFHHGFQYVDFKVLYLTASPFLHCQLWSFSAENINWMEALAVVSQGCSWRKACQQSHLLGVLIPVYTILSLSALNFHCHQTWLACRGVCGHVHGVLAALPHDQGEFRFWVSLLSVYKFRVLISPTLYDYQGLRVVCNID